MPWIKVLLIAFFLIVLVAVFRHRQRVELRAGSRIMAIVLGALAVASIADPAITQRAAEAVGVTRGTDLILYVLVVVFVFTSLGLYFRLRESDRRVQKLARAIAIAGAVEEGGRPGQRDAATSSLQVSSQESPSSAAPRRPAPGPVDDSPASPGSEAPDRQSPMEERDS